MDVKEAVQSARLHIVDVFSAEEITNVGLEEVEFDQVENVWKVTIGFTRPWERQGALGVSLGLKTVRSYKVVRIANGDGTIKSVMDRVLPAPNH